MPAIKKTRSAGIETKVVVLFLYLCSSLPPQKHY